MAVTKGSSGVIKAGSQTIGEVKSYSIDSTANTIDTTQLSDSATSFVAGNTSFSGSADVFWDPDDTGQQAVTIGSSVTLNLYPEGTATSSKYYNCSVIITGISRSGAIDGTVDATISFQGSGALTETTA